MFSRANQAALCLIVLAGLCQASRALTAQAYQAEAPDVDQWTISLNGTWQFAAPGSTDYQPAEVPGYWGKTAQGQKVGWQEVAKWATGTYRRDFNVPEDRPGAVLDFDMIRWGGQVFVNGQLAGEYDLGYSPVSFDVSHLTKPGSNIVEVKPRGWSALERYKGEDIQIPMGAGNWFGIKEGGIPSDVFLRLFRGARIDALRIVPRIDGPSCDVSTRVIAGRNPWTGRLAVQVVSEDGRAVSAVKRVAIKLKPDETVEVNIQDLRSPAAKLWWPQSPTLHRLTAWLESDDGSVAAARDDVFGFRQVAIKGGQFYLNNRRLALFGATELVMYRMLNLLQDQTRLHNVQVKMFKAMNAVAFRSHVNPLPRRWIDLCDRNGILLLCEFPNFPDVQRKADESPYELPDYWKNLQREIRGIIANRFNHPSIVSWVASNEGSGYGDWERRNLVPFVKSLDPTRFVMLSGDIAPEVADQHNFAGMWWGTQAQFERQARELAEFHPDRLVGCTEYGQYHGGRRWYGMREPPRDSSQFRRDRARILMTQTEVLRRARFDIIMPFAYPGGWLGKAGQTGRLEDAGEPFGAVRNALAPLGVSLEFDRRHAQAGAVVEIPVWVMSDSETAAGRVEVQVSVLDKHPGYNWNGKLEGIKVLGGSEFSVEISPWQVQRRVVSLQMPKASGSCCLAAVVRNKGEREPLALSLRAVRVHEPPPPAKRRLVVGVLENDGRLARWLNKRGHEVVLVYGGQRPDVIVIGEGTLYDQRLRTYGFAVANRVLKEGCRLVVLEQPSWQAEKMQDNMGQMLEELSSWPLQTAVANLFPEAVLAKAVGTAADFQRLNGIEGIGMRVALIPSDRVVSSKQAQAPAKLTPDVQEDGQTATTQPADGTWRPLIHGYGSKGKLSDWALAYRAYGKGEVFACQIPLTGRTDDRTPADFDPVAERLLAFMIEADRLASPQ